MRKVIILSNIITIKLFLISLLFNIVIYSSYVTYSYTECTHNKIIDEIGLKGLKIKLQKERLQELKIGVIDIFNSSTNHGDVIQELYNGNESCPGLIPETSNIIFYAMEELSTDQLIKNIEVAIQDKVNILSISLGTYNENQYLRSVIEKAISNGIIVVASAGNVRTQNMNYPASYPGVISVGSIDNDLNIINEFTYNTRINIFAPGKEIEISGEKYSGTSVSVPYVTSLVFLLMASNDEEINKDIINKLRENSRIINGKWNGQQVTIQLMNYKMLLEENKMSKKRIYISVFFIALALIVAVISQMIFFSKDSLSETEIPFKALIEQTLNDNQGIQETAVIINKQLFDEGVIFQFSFTDKKNAFFEGVAYTYKKGDRWVLEQINTSKNDDGNKLTTRTSTVTMIGNGYVGQKYYIVSGIVSDSTITEIRLTFNDGEKTILKLNENQKTFFTTKLGTTSGLSKIECFDKNGNAVVI
ncbi:S8 family serine peptidase [Paenibacillus koleovorans]|uniref:S8 family serine peptidase n=1 Tax=Paenibacillus koleovorans TaxID=121608 RepID=UPI000FDB18D0|nr:S8 family serine peptidase [Paenibacillus koleovorans]